jgi:ribonucleoside-diphosphate reductase alpha chain
MKSTTAIKIRLADGKVNSQADTAARDSAVIASLALQHGAPVETLRRALLRDSQGNASGPLGCALDLIVGEP